MNDFKNESIQSKNEYKFVGYIASTNGIALFKILFSKYGF